MNECEALLRNKHIQIYLNTKKKKKKKKKIEHHTDIYVLFLERTSIFLWCCL